MPNPATGTIALRITFLCYLIELQFTAENTDAGKRLDLFVQQKLPEYSRSRIQDWIKSGRVLVGGKPARASYAIHDHDAIDVEPAQLAPLKASAEDLPLTFLYVDEALIAVDKPAGMVVHAGAGRHTGTVVNALLHRFGELSTEGGDERPGIVHRLDKETSGVLLVARTDAAHRNLSEQFSSRTVRKSYTALVQGILAQDTGHIRTPIERDPVRRTRMTTRSGRGRTAHTEYRIIERFDKFTLLDVDIHTGRTHQIRVHLASIRHPVAGDTLYGATDAGRGRFFLHARRISIRHPITGEPLTVETTLPDELASWLTELQAQKRDRQL